MLLVVMGRVMVGKGGVVIEGLWGTYGRCLLSGEQEGGVCRSMHDGGRVYAVAWGRKESARRGGLLSPVIRIHGVENMCGEDE